MKHRVNLLAGLAALATLFFGVSAARAQGQEEDAKPKAAARAYLPLVDTIGDDASQQSPDNLQADMRPLTGVQNPTLGIPGSRHSYWVPGVQYGNTMQSRPFNGGQSSGWYSSNYFTGNVSLLDAWSHSQLSLNFSGGGSYSTDSVQGSSFFSQLGLIQSFQWERWQLQFIDQFAYLPESQFGFGGGTSLGIPGVGGSLGPQLPGLGGNYVPNQSIFTSLGSRYTNSFVTQANYELSPRGSITVAGSYGTLRFANPGNISSDQVIASLGYNYVLTRKDTVGVSYRFGGYHYSGDPQAIGDHAFNLVYGRKIRGRLALQLFGGPEVTTFRVPIGSVTSQVIGSGGASLTYGLSRGGVSLKYNQGLTGGSGTLIGANTSQVLFAANRQLTRQWNGDATFGFARNQNIASASSGNSQSFNSWIFGFGLVRPVGRNASLSFGYSARIQATSLFTCVAGKCSTNQTQSQIILGLSWHARPFVLR